MTPPELVFSLAPGQNMFFHELARALAFEIEELGARARVSVGEISEHRPGVVTVLLPPHEFVALGGVRPNARILQRCVFISAEQPSTAFFSSNVELARDAGAVLDINQRAVRAYEAEGIAAEHLRLGYSQAWDRRGTVSERDVDILFIGRATDRREAALAAYANVLERFECRFFLADNTKPSVGEGATFIAGDNKLELLARAKVLLNIHGEGEPYFEWLRVAEAVSAGCAIVTEHSTDVHPLRPGQDMIVGRPETLGMLAAWLAEDSETRAEFVANAESRLRGEASLTAGARSLLAAAERVDNDCPASPHVAKAAQAATARMMLHTPLPPPLPTGAGGDVSASDWRTLRTLKRQQYELLSLRRTLAANALERRRPDQPAARTIEVGSTPAWQLPRPKVSVIVPLFNDDDVVIEALDSVLHSTMPSWELVVVDDASTDNGSEAVLAWMAEHPDRPALLVRHEVNRGLPHARNTGVSRARSELLLMLDSDNKIRKFGLARLVEAVEKDPSASFAYGILDRFDSDGPAGLISKFGWEPSRLREGNYIDALALFRREALIAMGGYSDDSRLALGLEDYDLWARLAEAGRRGAFVRQFVGSYRVGHSSMLSVTGISSTDAVAAIAEHAPTLMSGIELPI
jgi:Glycosyl transferase family 2